jgi:beta-glucosidase
VNYYTDDLVAFDWRAPTRLFTRQHADEALPRSTYGWSIDAGGLHRALVRLWEELRLPIVVTENGVADEDDELRPGYIVDHLAAVAAAVADGADVRGYLYWTALDNFEWAQGYSQRFGLFRVDRETLERRPKPSAEVFARICRAGGIPDGLPGGRLSSASPSSAEDGLQGQGCHRASDEWPGGVPHPGESPHRARQRPEKI